MTDLISSSNEPYDVAVVGGGPAGLAAAIGLALGGARTALVAKRAPYADNRTTALLGQSVDFLDSLGVWSRCVSDAAPLRVMRLVDDTGRLIRAPEVRFSSDEIGCDVFGYNVENRILVEALEGRAAELAGLTRIDDDAESVVPRPQDVAIRTRQGRELTARLLVGADGRHSLSRDAAGIEVSRRPLNQTAVTFNVSHSRPHGDVSTEFHTVNGPCVFVPLPGDRTSIVWVTTPRETERLMALDDEALALAAEQRSHSILGRMRVEGARHTFPLAIEKPKRLATQRVVLVGESAHVVPPIGAQGLNLGLRDASDIADIVVDALGRGEDPGAPAALARFERMRRPDIASRTFAIDIANRSLLSTLLPVQGLRALGMLLLGHAGPLRRLAMREGLAPSWRTPRGDLVSRF
ncbi:MAG: UbiH/UbiF family hydroxylase [Xanthobacteraceae bacterium]